MKFRILEVQKYSSAGTSLNQIPSLHNKLINKKIIQDKDIILDYGGGKYDTAANYIKKLYPNSIIYVHDLFNRKKKHNIDVESEIENAGGADVILLSNVLNVVREPKTRIKIFKNLKKFMKKDKSTKVYITIYNAPRKVDKYSETDGIVGQESKDGCWQNCQNLDFYVPEVEKVFKNVKKLGGMLIIDGE